VTSDPSVPVCSAILKWERERAQEMQGQAMQGQAVWGWSRFPQMAPDLPSRAARESCACASAHPA